MDQELKFVWSSKPRGLKSHIRKLHHRLRFGGQPREEMVGKRALKDSVRTTYLEGRIRPVDLDMQAIRKFTFELRNQDGNCLIRLLTREIDFDGRLETAPRGWEELHRLGNRQWEEKGRLSWKPNTIGFFWVYVNPDPELRRRGLATRLVEQITEWATAKGYSYLFAPALPSSRRTSRDLYRCPSTSLPVVTGKMACQATHGLGRW